MIRVYYYLTLVVILPHSKSVRVRSLPFISVFAVMLVNIVARSRGSYRHQSWIQMLYRHVEKCAFEGQRHTYVFLPSWNQFQLILDVWAAPELCVGASS